MKLPPKSNLTEAKYQKIIQIMGDLKLNLDDIEESFVRGSGSGGQKINKTSSAVQLKHVLTGITVKCQKHRERSMNRILALRELLEKLNPETQKGKEIEKIRKQKKRRIRRNKNIE